MAVNDDGLFTFEITEAAENTEDTYKSVGIPIPPRTAASALPDNPITTTDSPDKAEISGPAVLKDKMELLQKLSSLKILRGPVKNDFIEKARKYAEVEVDSAEYVPFNNYWPTYDDMSTRQKQWYFYWRKCVRTNVYPSTDVSYIFIYVYEIINGIGFENCLDGFLKLCMVWSHYRSNYNSLDRHLSSWVYDFIHVYNDGMSISEILAHIPDSSLLVHFPDYMLGEYMKNPLSEMPIELISRFSDYKFHKGTFCLSESGGLLLKLAPGCLKQINLHLHKFHNKSLFDLFDPPNKSSRCRLPFQNALYNGDVKEITVYHSYYVVYLPLREFVTSVMKHLENCLRKQTGFKGKLRGYNLDKEVCSVIEKYVIEEFNKSRLEYDMSQVIVDRDRIIQLINDSDEVRFKLLQGIEDDVEQTMEVQVSVPDFNAPDSKEGSTEKCTEGSIEESNKENNVYENFVSSLSETGLEIIRFMFKNNCRTEEHALSSAFPSVFVRVEIDQINSCALETIGDLIFAEENEGNSWIIYEDYIDPLKGVTLFG